ncbi:MFS transporter small subunit [Microbacterium karelineae]|nr:hypothetical protein [Microbacterium karelineae]
MNEQDPPSTGSSQTARIVVSWAIVGIPLVYALVQTAISVTPLFTG